MIDLRQGDCLEVLRRLPAGSVDVVVTDPPYPCIKRPYGYWTEAEWFALMNPVVEECRRVLKPTGSAVFVLQPNSEKAGRMRPWLFEFQAKWCREWGMVQDAYWWNYTSIPSGGATELGLLRGSVKACVWLGSPDCYRDQEAVLWGESERNIAMRMGKRMGEQTTPSGRRIDRVRCGEAAALRGGVTPFNLLPVGGCNRWQDGGGAWGHGASTPIALCRWWVRYICPPDGTVLDPFVGSGTVALAALHEGRSAIGIERDTGYFAIAQQRVEEASGVITPAGLFNELEA